MNYDHIANRFSSSDYFSCEVDTECKKQLPTSRHSNIDCDSYILALQVNAGRSIGILLLDIEHLPHSPKITILVKLTVS